MEPKQPTFKDIKTAYNRINGDVHKTPVLTSTSIDSICGAKIFFKCENLQKVGAFKFRGATNAVLSLSQDQAQKGVATHSSGNHAAACALAAKKRGIKSYIVMPKNSPEIKKKAVADYGAEITFCEPTLAARETTLEKIVEKTGAHFIHPYNDFDVICGQGTAAFELVTEIENLDIVMTPVGGGGLLSGTSIAVKGMCDGKVVGTEPSGADDAYRSFKSKTLIPSKNPKTIADGLLTSLGSLTFAVIINNVDDIVTVEEATIIKAMRLVWERMKIIIEPSAAVPLAAILEKKLEVRGKRVGIILSGGNVDLERLPFKVKPDAQ